MARLKLPLPLHEFIPAGLAAILVLGVGLSLVLGIAPPVALAFGAAGLLITSSVNLFSKWKTAKKNLLLVSCTAQFLLKGDSSSLDDLLQALIEDNLKDMSTDAVGGFFDCIDERVSPGSSYEEKRRIAEALPALFKMETERAKQVARVLRTDWDAEKWGADNRRRVVEAIVRTPKLDHAFVEEMLRLVEGDDQYVALACAELLNGLLASWGGERVDALFNLLLKDMQDRSFKHEEIISIRNVWDLIALFGDSGKPALQRCKGLLETGPHLVQVSVARNLHRFSRTFPTEMLQLMQMCLQLRGDQHKNVRRPMARKSSMDSLIGLLRNARFREAAQEMIMRLVKDDDKIIATTSFDKADTIFTADKEVGKKMILAGLESNIKEVRSRAERAARRHSVTA